jgi:DNA integrity scanning protein DisA with diadenylate cyclase activity
MEIKKSEKANLESSKLTWVLIGLVVVLAAHYVAFEWTQYEQESTGEIVDAVVSVQMIENIFFKNTPLHDGAMVIAAGRIHAAACILPVSKRQDLPKSYGLRHRAALGLTEKTDAIAIIVSEETGKISVAQGDSIKAVTTNELEHQYLAPAFGIEYNKDNNKTK